MNRKLIIFLSLIIFVVVFITVLVIGMTRTGDGQGSEAQKGVSPEIATVLPASDGKQAFLPVQQVQFTFTAPIDLATFSYTVSPKTETTVTISDDQRSVTISPKIIWQEGAVTIITISRRTKALGGRSLKEAFIYKLRAEFPKVDTNTHERY